MSGTWESRLQNLVALSTRANEAAEARIRELIKEMILQKIQRGGSDLAEKEIKLFRTLTKAVSQAAPKNKYAQAFPGIVSTFVESQETRMLERYLRAEGKIDRMKGSELFRLWRTFTEKHRVEEVLDSLDETSS